MRTALVYHFSSAGFNVLSAENGRIGLDLALKEIPDIILLDVMMPELDGVTVMNTLRKANDWGKNVPIIFLTSLFDDDDIMQGVPASERGNPEYSGFKDRLSLADIVEKVKKRLEG